MRWLMHVEKPIPNLGPDEAFILNRDLAIPPEREYNDNG